MARPDSSRPAAALHSVQNLAALVDGTVEGDGAFGITGVAPLETAGPRHLAFVLEKKFLRDAQTSRAGAFVLGRGLSLSGRILIRVDSPRLALSKLLSLFAPPSPVPKGVDPRAVVAEGARIGRDASIGPFVVIESGAIIGDRVTLYPGVYVGARAEIGDDCLLYPRVTLYHDVRLGKRVIIHSGTVVGSDGFGFTPDRGKWIKVPQIGRVAVEDDVEIQSNCAIDRGTLGETRIGRGTKIDNLVHIAHNVAIGPDCVLAAQGGASGSVTMEDHVMVGGQAGVSQGVRIGSGSELAAQSGVGRDLAPGSKVAGFMAQDIRDEMKTIALTRRLFGLFERVGRLEKKHPSDPPKKRRLSRR